MANPSPTCQVREGAGAWQDTTNGVDVTAGSSLTIRLVDTSPYAWSLECIGTDETNSVTAVNAGLVVNNAAKTATLTAPAVGSALLFRSTVNGGVAADGTARPSYSATFKISVLTATGFRVGAFGETIENDSNYGTAPLVNELVRTVDGLVSGGTGDSVTLVGSLAIGDVACSANDPTDRTKVKIGTLANLQAAGIVAGVMLEAGNNGDSKLIAGPGSRVDVTVHGLAAQTAIAWVVVNTANGHMTVKTALDGSEYVVGTLTPGSGGTGGILTVLPERPSGKPTISILDPKYGVDLTTGELAAAFPKAFEDVRQGGRVVIPRRTGASAQLQLSDEVFIDRLADGTPLQGIVIEGESPRVGTAYGTQINLKLDDFSGTDVSIGAVDTATNTVEVSIPLATLSALGVLPLNPRQWVDHWFVFNGAQAEWHKARLLCLAIKDYGSDGVKAKFTCALRGSYLTMCGVVAQGTSPPSITITGGGTSPATANAPVNLRVECNDVSGGTARGQAKVRISYDGGATWAVPSVTTAATIAITGGLTLNLGTGTYAVDQVWTSSNFCGNDTRNGSIDWRLLRFAFHRRSRQQSFRKLILYGAAGHYCAGWFHMTESAEPPNSLPNTDHFDEDLQFDAYPAATYDPTLSLAAYPREVNGYGPSKFGQEYAKTYAWPIAPRPGTYRYRSTTESSITAYVPGGAVVVGDRRRPATATGIQWRCTRSGTCSNPQPATIGAWVARGTTYDEGGIHPAWVAEYADEQGSSLTAWTANENLGAAPIGTVRRATTPNGLKLVLVVQGTCGSSEPTGYKFGDLVVSGGATFRVDYDAGTATFFAPLNNDYYQDERVNCVNVGWYVHCDNSNGQSREHTAWQVNVVGCNGGFVTDEARYTNECGMYLQAKWQGGSFACHEAAVHAPLGGLSMYLEDLLCESGSRVANYGATVGGNLVCRNLRLTMPGASPANYGSLHRSKDVMVIGTEQAELDNVEWQLFSDHSAIALNYAPSFSAGPASASLSAQKISVRKGQLVSTQRRGTYARLQATRRGQFALSNGQTVKFTLTPGTGSPFPAAVTFTATFVTADFANIAKAKPHEVARRINKDCGNMWWASTTFAANAVVTPHNSFEYYVSAGGGGSSGATEPTWPTTIGATVTDGALTWTCRERQTPSLWAWTDRFGRLFVELITRGASTPEAQTSPKTWSKACDTIGIDQSGTATLELGFNNSATSYAESEVENWSRGSFRLPGGTAPELVLDALDARLVDGASAVHIATLSERFVSPQGGTASPGRDSVGARHMNRTIVSASHVPLRNPPQVVTISGDQVSVPIPFWDVENDASYYARPPVLVATSGSPAAGTVSVVLTAYGWVLKRSAACGGVTSESYLVELVRVPTVAAWDLNSIVGAANVNWWKAESLVAGAVTSWANSGTVGSNRMSALTDNGSGNGPVAALDAAAGRMGATFTAASSQYLISSTLGTVYNEPVSILATVGGLASPTSYRRLWDGKTDKKPYFQYWDNGGTPAWQLGGRVTDGAAMVTTTSLGDPRTGRHVISATYGNLARGGSRRVWSMRHNLDAEQGTNQSFDNPASNGALVTCDGLTLFANYARTTFLSGTVYDVAVIHWTRETGVNRDELGKAILFLAGRANAL